MYHATKTVNQFPKARTSRYVRANTYTALIDSSNACLYILTIKLHSLNVWPQIYLCTRTAHPCNSVVHSHTHTLALSSASLALSPAHSRRHSPSHPPHSRRHSPSHPLTHADTHPLTRLTHVGNGLVARLHGGRKHEYLHRTHTRPCICVCIHICIIVRVHTCIHTYMCACIHVIHCVLVRVSWASKEACEQHLSAKEQPHTVCDDPVPIPLTHSSPTPTS